MAFSSYFKHDKKAIKRKRQSDPLSNFPALISRLYNLSHGARGKLKNASETGAAKCNLKGVPSHSGLRATSTQGALPVAGRRRGRRRLGPSLRSSPREVRSNQASKWRPTTSTPQ